MRYLLIQSKHGYREYPIMEERGCEQESRKTDSRQIDVNEISIRKVRNDDRVFCLSGERHMFERGENVSISSGEEAEIGRAHV